MYALTIKKKRLVLLIYTNSIWDQMSDTTEKLLVL